MKLEAYLEWTGESDYDFARRVKLSINAIRKYRYGVRIPRPENLLRIKKATKNMVAEADWYN